MNSIKTIAKNFFLLSIFTLFLVSCNNDDNNGPTATINVTSNAGGDMGGDFTGNGGSASQTVTFANASTTADVNFDITGATGGTFRMVIRDSQGTTVLDESLLGGVEPDTFSGVTSAGQAGDWAVTLTAMNFAGDGSYSISQGN